MNSTVVIIAIVAFLALDLVFYYLIIRRMDRPSPSAAFARARDFSVIPESEGESVGLRLRERLAFGRGDLYDIVVLPLTGGEGYLFTTLPEENSHLPRTRENRRQFMAVLVENPLDGGLLIHPSIRPPFSGFKRRRLLRVFRATTYFPKPADRLSGALAGRYAIRTEHETTDPEKFLTPAMLEVLPRVPRKRGFVLWVGPGGLIIYINPLLAGQEEAGKFYDFAVQLTRVLSREGL